MFYGAPQTVYRRSGSGLSPEEPPRHKRLADAALRLGFALLQPVGRILLTVLLMN